MKKFISVLLAMMLLCCGVALAAKPVTDDTQASNYFTSYGMSVSAIGGGKIYMTFSCSSVGVADQLGVATYCVQRRDSSGNWEDVTGLLPGSTKANTTSHSFSKTFHGVKGETYRVKCTFYCQKGNGSEHKAYTSGKKKAT